MRAGVAQIGERLGWSREQVRNYSAVLSKVGTQILILARRHQEGRVPPNGTGVPTFNFTEGWFRMSDRVGAEVSGFSQTAPGGSCTIGWCKCTNLQREKTFSQKMAEAEELEAVERERARRRQAATQLAGRVKGGEPIFGGGKIATTEEKGKTRDKVAAANMAQVCQPGVPCAGGPSSHPTKKRPQGPLTVGNR